MQYDERDEQVVEVVLQSQLTIDEWQTLKRREEELGHSIEEWLEELAPTTGVFSMLRPDGIHVVGFTCNVASHRYPEPHLLIIDIIRGFCAGKSLRELNSLAIAKFPAEHREVVNVWDQMLEAEDENDL